MTNSGKSSVAHHRIVLFTGALAVVIVIGIAAIVAGFGPTMIWDGYGEVVILTNKGSKPLSDLVLRFAGGECRLSVLPANTQRTLIMNLYGESPISLSFTDAAGSKHGSAQEIYLEPGYKGTVDISVDSANKVVWKNNTEPFPAH